MRKIAIVLCVMVLAAAAQSSLADGPWSPTPALSSLERAAAYLDSAQTEFDHFITSIRQGRAEESRTALRHYVQNLSGLHVQLAALRVGKQERGFVSAIAGQLNVQRSQLQSLVQTVQPQVQSALREAIGHLDRTSEVAEEKLDGHVPSIRWRYGWKPTEPEKRWQIPR